MGDSRSLSDLNTVSVLCKNCEQLSLLPDIRVGTSERGDFIAPALAGHTNDIIPGSIGRENGITPESSSPSTSECDVDGGSSDDIDDVDGHVTVAAKIRCMRCSSIKNRGIETPVLQPTPVYEYIQRQTASDLRVENVPRRPRRNSWFMCFVSQKSTELGVLGSTNLYYKNPQLPDAPYQLPFGVTIVTIIDNDEQIRHFVKTVTPYSVAEDLCLKERDELLALNEVSLLNKDMATMESMFASVKTGQQFSLIIKRRKDTEMKSSEVEYSYYEVKATIRVEEEKTVDGNVICVLRSTEVTSRRYKEGDIIVVTEGFPKAVYIQLGYKKDEIKNMYLIHTNNKLHVQENLRTDNPAYRFYMTTYDYLVIKNSRAVKENDKRARIFRPDASKEFVVVDEDEVKLKEKPSSLSLVPAMTALNQTRVFAGGFDLQKAVFLARSVTSSQADEQLLLESRFKRHNYLRYYPERHGLGLEFSSDEDMLVYDDNARFIIQNV